MKNLKEYGKPAVILAAGFILAPSLLSDSDALKTL